MKKKNVYQTQRKEIKTAKGFYKRLEKIKANDIQMNTHVIAN